MKNVLRLEEVGILALSVYLSNFLPYAWWWYWVLFLAPDIGLTGYAVNPRAGALIYNLFHHKGIAVLIYITGLSTGSHELQFTGLLLLGHSSFDRILGYGLKYADNFHNTHLGLIGKAAYDK
jgi:hypothetical protein